MKTNNFGTIFLILVAFVFFNLLHVKSVDGGLDLGATILDAPGLLEHRALGAFILSFPVFKKKSIRQSKIDKKHLIVGETMN